MTLAVPTGVVSGGPAREIGTLVVWRLELAKLMSQVRVRAVTAVGLIGPFLVVLAVKVQGSLPTDTLFGQWLHESGFALPMVVLAGAAPWGLPLIAAVVAGDVFSAEDHFGTWKTVLTRSRTRGQIFAGKVLAALTYTVVELVLLAVSSLAAGLLLGSKPVVGLSGQLVPAGSAAALVTESWATQLPPMLGFCCLAFALSILTRSSTVGIGGPLLAASVMNLAAFVNMPVDVQEALLTTGFGSWHGLWVQEPFYGPMAAGLITSVGWSVAGLCIAWTAFRKRAFGAW